MLARDPEPDPGLATLTSAERLWLRLTGAPWLTELQANAAKLSLALASLALLGFGMLVKRGAAGDAAVPATLEAVPWGRRALFPAATLASAPLLFLAVAATWPHGQGSAWAAAALGLAAVSAAALVACLRAASTGSFYRRAGASVARTSLPRLRAGVLLALAVTS